MLLVQAFAGECALELEGTLSLFEDGFEKHTEQEQRNPEKVLKKILAAIPEKKVISPETFQLPEILTSYQFPVSSGCRKLMFDIAQNLYKKFGFEINGVRKQYYKNPDNTREDAILMTKEF